MENSFDIAVVGGGPAGSMSALNACREGVSVCLIERKTEFGIPVRCGEGIGKKGLLRYVEPRQEWIKATVKRSMMVSPSGIKVQLGNVEESFILDREKMDADLVRMAEKAGTKIFSGTTVLSVKQNADKTYTLLTTGVTITARIVIIADGVESKIARCLGWNTKLDLKDLETAAFARVVSPFIEKESCVFYTGSVVAPGGYAWVFPRGNGEANVGLAISGDHSNPGLARKLLDKFIEKEFPAARAYNYHCGGVPVAKWLKPLSKNGVMIVGDAAHQVNALSGGGISFSLFAGKLAGSVASKAINNGTVDYVALDEYERTWKKKFGKQQERSYKLKEFLAKNGSDAFLDRIAHSLSKENPEKINYLRVFLKTFAKHPVLLYKAFQLFR
ncbi:MAG: NAD(P)/FAD-dependent oxidoreductase [Fibrobacterota bacterium]|nr:NAD(P)/FAD-dependent oxidoreductase [Chitinispirillaceae bacterium]